MFTCRSGSPMASQVSKTLPSARLSLQDRLSRLTFLEACKLLGPEGKTLIQLGARNWEHKIQEDVYLGGDLFRLRFPTTGAEEAPPVVVTVTMMAEARNRLRWNCNRCQGACEHVG